ncbi:MAG: hypothetical protein IRZ06_07540 [Nevskia sp.]|nr:hypothetical protein [Nevskia sp.]
MPLFRRRTAHWIAWLALAAVFYRALIPAGFMPANAEQARGGAILVLCSGGLLKTIGAHDPSDPSRPQTHVEVQCPFAAAAAPALPPAIGTLPALRARHVAPATQTLFATQTEHWRWGPARAPPALS